MGIQSHFDKFHNKIKLGRQDDVYKKARDRDDNITADVKNAFSEADHPVVATFIQGSLATNTGVIPLNGDYDVDRALVIDAECAPDDPVDPKITVFDVLDSRGFKNAKIKKPCVTADYASDNVHIDFPVYKRSGEQYYLAVGKRNSGRDNREWSAADPRGLLDWINDRTNYGDCESVKHDQFRRLVRYLKRWRDCQFSETVAAKVYSIGLTVMVKERFIPAFDTEEFSHDLSSLRQTVSSMLDGGYFTAAGNDQYRISVYLPKQPWRDIFFGSSVDTGTQFRNKLERLETKLAEADTSDDEREQCTILNALFCEDFVVPDASTTGHTGGRKAIFPSAGLVGTSQGA